MISNPPGNQARRSGPRRSNDRPTIGVLMSNLNRLSDTWTLEGLQDTARERDANLIVFQGHPLESRWSDEAKYNILYDLVGAENVDGLVVEVNKLGSTVGEERMKVFCGGFGMPVISLGTPLEGFPSVSIDAYAAMYQAIVHLVEAHGLRRIAFARGRQTSFEMEERYRAYVDVLAAYGLSLDPNLVVSAEVTLANVKDLVSGKLKFSYASADEIRDSLVKRRLRAGVSSVTDVGPGELVVPFMLHERGLRPGVDFDAIVASGNLLALGVLGGLKQEGVRVPSEVAVIGSGEIREAPTVTPPLTTAMGRETLYAVARRAAGMLLDVLEGRPVSSVVEVQPEMVLRESCGCLSPAVAQVVVPSSTRRARKTRGPAVPFEDALAAARKAIVAEVAQALGVASSTETIPPPETTEQVNRLLDAFAEEVGGGVPAGSSSQRGTFLNEWAEALGATVGVAEVGSWHTVLSILRHHLQSLVDDADRAFAEDLWQQARVMVGEATLRARGLDALGEEMTQANIRMTNERMLSTTELEPLRELLAARLPGLGIGRHCIAVFQNPDQPADRSRLLAFSGFAEDVELDSDEAVFRSRLLTPARMHHSEERYDLLIQGLIAQEQRIGYILFDLDPALGGGYIMVSRMLANSLYGIMLRQQVNRRARQLEAAAEIATTAGIILDPEELVREAVELIRERFDLYYVGLFLVGTDQPTGKARWAVLRAGTGEAGRQMLAQGHRLEIGGGSMIGWCVAHKQARIALDVGDEAVRFDNPWLPDTRSEMALPLISRGGIIGALTIQSDRSTAFEDEDIASLQTMAAQLANALENARLVERSEQQLRELSLLHREYLTEAWGQQALAERPSGYVYDQVDVRPAADIPPLAHNLAVQRGEIVKLDASESSGAMLAVPLKIRGQVIGSIGIESGDGRAWTPTELAVMETVGEQVAEALQSAQLFAESQKAAEQMQALYETSRLLSSSMEEAALMHSTLEAVHRSLNCDLVLIAAVDDRAETIQVQHTLWRGELDARPDWVDVSSQGLDASTIWADVYRTGQTEVIGDWDPRFDLQLWESSGLGEFLHVFMPIALRGRVLGVIGVAYDKQTKDSVSEEEKQMLSAFMDQAAVALENVHLFEQAQQRAQRELQILEITTKLRRSPDVATILQTAVEELGQALRTDRAVVRLVTKPREEQQGGAEKTVREDVVVTGAA